MIDGIIFKKKPVEMVLVITMETLKPISYQKFKTLKKKLTSIRESEENSYIDEDELEDKERMIYENEDFIAFAPYASVVPYNVVILPKKHESCFVDVLEEDVRSLASILRLILQKLYYLLDDPDYNYVIDSSPIDKSGERHYHWHLDILPRLATRAGFEIGSGININTILPEDCAKSLRELKI